MLQCCSVAVLQCCSLGHIACNAHHAGKRLIYLVVSIIFITFARLLKEIIKLTIAI